MSHPYDQHPIVVFCREKLDDLVAAVPRGQRDWLTGESIMAALLGILAPSPDDDTAKALRDCHPARVYDTLRSCLRLGLDPSPGRGQFYLVPRSGACTGQVGSQGKVELAYRSGVVTKIVCNVVYEDDDFMVDLANGVMHHTLTKERIREKPGPILCAYARIWTKGATDPIDELMRPSDMATIREKAAKGGKSPAWKDYEAEMWRRSTLNRALKRLPKTPALAEALAEDLAPSTPSVGVSAPGPLVPDRDVEERLAALRGDETPPPQFNGAAAAAEDMP